MNSKFSKILPFIFLGALLLVCVFFAIDQIPAWIDPAGHNYRIDHLNKGEAVDAYLYTAENIISLVTVPCFALFLIAFVVLRLLKKNSSLIGLVEIGNGLVFIYGIVRVIFLLMKGSTSIPVAIFYIGSLVGIGMMFYQFPKRTLDGDSLLPYYIGAIVGAALFLFASATSSSYSLLNAYGHIGDVVYWGGFWTTRLAFWTFAFLVYFNLNFNFDPSLVEKKAE